MKKNVLLKLIYCFCLLICANANAQNKPSTPSATAAKPSTQSATVAKSNTPKPNTQNATAAKPNTPTATAAKPTTQSATAAKPTTQSATAAKPNTQSATAAKPNTPNATAAKPNTPNATAAKPNTPNATATKPNTQTPTAIKPNTPIPTAEKPKTVSTTAEKTTIQSPTTAKSNTQTGTVGKPLTPKVETPKTVAPTPKKTVKVVEDKGQSDDVEIVNQETDTDYFVKKKNSLPKNVFKLDLLEVFDGTFPLFYERVVTQKISVQLGVGVTSFKPLFAEYRPIYSGISDDDYLGYEAKPQTGLFLSIGAKYYAGRNTFAPEGAYLAVESQFKQYKFETVQEYSNGNAGGDKAQTTITNFDMFRVLFGFQGEEFNNFTYEPQLGFGWRKHTYDGWIKDDNLNPILGSVSTVKPVLVFGFKIGLRF
jgi:hypothetical protein